MHQNDLALKSLSALNELMRSRPPHSKEERKRRSLIFQKSVVARMLEQRVSFGEAGGRVGTAVMTDNEAKFRKHLKAINNDLEEQVRIVSEAIKHYFEHGSMPAPYYPWRIAVILRKTNQHEHEVAYLEALASLFPDWGGERFGAIKDRIIKAKNLAAKKIIKSTAS